MKTLLLLRHAKSSWKDTDVADHDRPLNARGKDDAPRMGKLLRQQTLTPEVIVSSTATRARRTADAVADRCAFDGSVHLEPRLYLAAPGAILEVLRQVGGDAKRVLVVGHNPGLAELLVRLTGKVEMFPTAALAQIQLPIDGWKELRSSTRARLVKLWRPRELKQWPSPLGSSRTRPW